MFLSKTAFWVRTGVVIACGTPLLIAYPFGPPAGLTGAPGESTCAICHGNGTVNTQGGGIQLSSSSYTPGVKQRIVVEITDAAARRWGFEASARIAADNSRAGTLAPSDANTQVVLQNALEYVMQTDQGTRPGAASPVSFEFDWTPPDTDAGNVTFYVAANAANGNGFADAGDHVYSKAFTLTAAPATTSGPVIRAQDGVVNGASFAPGIAPGAWISVLGENLAPSNRTWRADEFIDGALPPYLSMVSVSPSTGNRPRSTSFHPGC